MPVVRVSISHLSSISICSCCELSAFHATSWMALSVHIVVLDSGPCCSSRMTALFSCGLSLVSQHIVVWFWSSFCFFTTLMKMFRVLPSILGLSPLGDFGLAALFSPSVKIWKAFARLPLLVICLLICSLFVLSGLFASKSAGSCLSHGILWSGVHFSGILDSSSSAFR